MEAILVQFDDEYSPLITDIRMSVFVGEQGIDEKIDFDGLDRGAKHALVIAGGVAVGTGRILADGHIGRIAVVKNMRNQSVGNLVLTTLVDEAKRKGFKKVYLGSQLHAKAFYEKLGFKSCGEIFIDAELEHIEMEMFLD